MSRYLLDSGLVIRHLRGRKSAVRLLRGLGKTNRLCIATVTRVEIFAGMRPEEAYATRKLLSCFVNLDLNRQIADRAGEYVRSGYAARRQIQVPDAIIAATATINNLTLVTLNTADFVQIPGLSLYPLEGMG
jgi:predicted nucleic acid-binding protein